MARRTFHIKPKSLRIDPGEPGSTRARINEHLEWLVVRNYTQAAVYGRAQVLARFVAWCEERGLIRPQEVTKPILERYQRHLFHYRKENGHPLGVSTQYGAIVVVRAFFRWLARENLILYNPASDLVLPRLGQRLPRALLTPTEVEQVMGAAKFGQPLGLRDRAIMEVFYSTGMRRRELAELLVYDVDHERGTVLIRQGKGQKDRVIPIGERALMWADKYIREVRPRLVIEPDPGFLFLTVEGEALHPDWLSASIRGYVEASGVPKRGACHLFRHTMATAMLEGGADIRFIQAMLGHADLRATEIYTQVSIRKLKDIHTATHPAALLLRKDKGRDGGADAGAVVDAQEQLLEVLEHEGDDEEEMLQQELKSATTTATATADSATRGSKPKTTKEP